MTSNQRWTLAKGEQKRKRQHYVPQFYMRNFSEDGKRFALLTSRGEVVDGAPVRSQCAEDYFYTEGLYEIELSIFEWTVAPIIKRIVTEDNTNLSSEEELLIKQFMIYQNQRASATAKYRFNQGVDVFAEAVKMRVGSHDISREEMADFIRENFRNFADLSYEMAKELHGNASDLSLAVISFPRDGVLVSCDNPCIFTNIYCFHAVGLLNAGLIILLPLSSNKLAIAYDSKMYKLKADNGLVADSVLINEMQLYNSNKVVFSHDKNVLRKLRKKQAKIFAMKEDSGNGVTSLGAPDEKMIIVQSDFSKIDFIANSFLKLIPQASSVPLNVRDIFLRVPDEAGHQRLNSYSTFSGLAKLSEVREATSVLSKDYSPHVNFVKTYWQTTHCEEGGSIE